MLNLTDLFYGEVFKLLQLNYVLVRKRLRNINAKPYGRIAIEKACFLKDTFK